MANLLLVDDEALSIDTLENGIRWGELGIHRVLTARSMHRACEIFRENPVDVMICDIEMPQNSGLDLLMWVRENGFDTISIFLTGHADFQYAKRAIELQSMEYLLKPVSFDMLSGIVLKALERVRRRDAERESARMAEMWQSNRVNMREQFWRDIAYGTIPASMPQLLEAANKRSISVDASLEYRPMLISSKRDFSTKSLRSEIKQRLDECFAACFPNATTPPILMDSRRAFAVLECRTMPQYSPGAKADPQAKADPEAKADPGALHDPSAMAEDCTKSMAGETAESDAAVRFLELARTGLGVTLCVTLGRPTRMDGIAEQVPALLHQDDSSVTDEGCVRYFSDASSDGASYHRPDLTLWQSFLRDGQLDALSRAISGYFEREREHRNLNAAILARLRHDYLQLVCSLLEANGISSHFIFGTPEAETAHANAVVSVSNMKDWMQFVNTRASTYFKAEKDARSTIEQVKSCIARNIFNDISRDAIAQQVRLNPEYLSRIFHKETGISLIKYIQGSKVEKAKELLRDTELGIGEVASRLGYSNFAYFSQLFRNLTGATPHEYRRDTGSRNRFTDQ